MRVNNLFNRLCQTICLLKCLSHCKHDNNKTDLPIFNLFSHGTVDVTSSSLTQHSLITFNYRYNYKAFTSSSSLVLGNTYLAV